MRQELIVYVLFLNLKSASWKWFLHHGLGGETSVVGLKGCATYTHMCMHKKHTHIRIQNLLYLCFILLMGLFKMFKV